jgi:tol-pal system protein YbgF
MKNWAFLTLSFLWLCACALPQQIDVVEREQRRMRNDLLSIHTDIDTLKSDVNSVRGTMADTRANTQQVQRDVNAMKERIEEARVQIGRQVGQTNREGDQRVKNLEARLAKLEEDLKAQGELLKSRDEEIRQLKESLQTAKQPPVASERAAELNLAESDGIRKDYEAAWQALDNKDYKVALTRFREFAKKYPKSKLSENAQYWVGECYYAMKQYDQAILEFDAVRRKNPQGDKVPAALLKQGFAFADLGEKVNARLILQEVIEKYPQSPEALTAKQRLKGLES